MEQRLTSIPCGFLSLNCDYIIEEVNNTFLEWTNFKREQLLGQHIENLLPTGNKLIFHSYFYPLMSEYGQIEELFIHLYNEAQEKIPFIMNAKVNEMNGGYYIDIILMQMKKRIDYEREVRNTKMLLEKAYVEKEKAYDHLQHIYCEIEQKQLELLEINNELVQISNSDKLTGIANRRYFQNQLAVSIKRYQDEQIPFSLLIIDIDYFKQVNDTYGHLVGDEVLVKLATILKDNARPEDTVARFGGEEFTIILDNTNPERALEIATNFNKQVEISIWPTIGQLTISIGCAIYQPNDTEDTLLQHADEALYYSKRNGRNQVTLYDV